MQRRILALAALLPALAVGCAATENSDEPATSVTVAALGASQVDTIDGTYGAGCTQREGAWSLRVGSSSAPLTNPALSVVQNDGIECVLSVTALTIGGTTYAAAPTVALADAFAAAPTSFGSGGAAFDANFRLTPSDFRSNVTLDVYLSSSAAVTTGSITATH